MSGVVGLVCENFANSHVVYSIIRDLLLLSESRGNETTGVSLLNNNQIVTVKHNFGARKFVKTEEFKGMFSGAYRNIIALGHTGLATPDFHSPDNRMDPYLQQDLAVVCDGVSLSLNCDDLLNPEVMQSQQFAKVFLDCLKRGDSLAVSQSAFEKLKGTANILALDLQRKKLTAGTNHGSLYYCVSSKDQTGHISVIFASERRILSSLIEKNSLASKMFSSLQIAHLCAGDGLCIQLRTALEITKFKFSHKGENNFNFCSSPKSDLHVCANSYHGFEIDEAPIKALKRCTKCILPETMPFIKFDKDGVCNYCHTYKKYSYKSREDLAAWAEKNRSKDGNPDSIVAFSGGRDSSYGLHYFVKEMGMNPVAFSYDWGMSTNIALRNQARMCQALGIELIHVAADKKKKRENICKNVAAWLKKPDLGMIPVFMAGDKQYFYYANQLKKSLHLDTVLMANNPFERTHFKTGFCKSIPDVLKKDGINHPAIEHLNLGGLLRMGMHYSGQFLQNPAYINTSLLDTISATSSFYVIPHNYFRLFNYIPWHEDVVNCVLREEYSWETAPDTLNTWRIGDGTAPFYNYIYYLVAGFTENDTLRSNQIREGDLTRDKALELALLDNQPRFDAMQWYFNSIGLDMQEALKVVNKIPKLYSEININKLRDLTERECFG